MSRGFWRPPEAGGNGGAAGGGAAGGGGGGGAADSGEWRAFELDVEPLTRLRPELHTLDADLKCLSKEREQRLAAAKTKARAAARASKQAAASAAAARPRRRRLSSSCHAHTDCLHWSGEWMAWHLNTLLGNALGAVASAREPASSPG